MEDAVSDSRDAATEHIASDSRDAATEHMSIKIAGYAVDRRRSRLAPKILLWLKYEVEHARHVPVTLAVLEEVGQNPELVQRRTWSGTLEGVSRCTAAYHNAFVAAQHYNCKDCVDSLRRHVGTLLSQIEDEWDRAFAIGLIHDFIENRATGMAVRQIVNASVVAEGESASAYRIWYHISERERLFCLDILDEILDQVTVQGNVLRRDLKTLYA